MKFKRKQFRKEYKLALDYIWDSRNFIYLAIGGFFVFSLAGLFLPVPEFIREKILEIIREILLQTEGLGRGELMGFIFMNNLQSSFFAIVFGSIFGIIPFVSSMFNGYLLGFVASLTIEREGILSLWRILPHGIFELPAVFISFGIGIKFGAFIFRKDKTKSFRGYLLNSLRVFFLIVLPLLIIAAIIEGTLISFGR
ncbi:hypothetical protein CMI44_00315 [Candidatus Pacearchaeota archaeon]|jgi:stage II sporulation protein M|nr:hypothetical protein [Candidatus Pacearchaeota archaeon]